MKITIEIILYTCLLVGLYHNWTDVIRPQPQREVNGLLEKFQNELPK